MVATAAPALRWLLVEDPGPWGPDAHPTGTIAADVASDLRRRAAAQHARLVLIRRHQSGHAVHQPGPRRYAWVTCTPGATATRWHLAGTDDELRALTDPGDASSIDGPSTIYLTCTQGRHDVCCALWGRPIARQLAALRTEASFECSHMGGDRFAANVVVLPWGLVYGQVELGDVGLLVEETEAGRLVPRLLRGRSWYAAPVQAALIHLSQTTLDRRIDAWTPVAHERSEDVWVVRVESPEGRTHVVEVLERHRLVDVPLTCAGRTPSRLRTFEVLGSR